MWRDAVTMWPVRSHLETLVVSVTEEMVDLLV